jgi:UV DNA damage repair endonuclease
LEKQNGGREGNLGTSIPRGPPRIGEARASVENDHRVWSRCEQLRACSGAHLGLLFEDHFHVYQQVPSSTFKACLNLSQEKNK